MNDFVGLVLAAGEGSRFGQPKAGVVLDGERLVDRAVRLMREAGAINVYVVLGAWSGAVPHAVTINNEQWRSGMGSSLQVGLQYLYKHEPASLALVTLVDLPGMSAQALRRVASSSSIISAATYNAERGHPVAFHRSVWLDVAQGSQGDVGARHYLQSHSDQVELIEVGDVASGEDLDFPI